MMQKNLQELTLEELKIKMEIEQAKARVKLWKEGSRNLERWQIRKI